MVMLGLVPACTHTCLKEILHPTFPPCLAARISLLVLMLCCCCRAASMSQGFEPIFTLHLWTRLRQWIATVRLEKEAGSYTYIQVSN